MNQFESTNFDGVFEVGIAKCRVAHSDLTAAATSQVLTFNTLAKEYGGRQIPANSRVMYAWINVIDGFAGGSVSAIVAKLGDAGSDNELITNVSVLDGAEGLKTVTGAYTLGTFESAYAPIITFTATDDNVVNLTSGVIEVFIQYQSIKTRAATK